MISTTWCVCKSVLVAGGFPYFLQLFWDWGSIGRDGMIPIQPKRKQVWKYHVTFLYTHEQIGWHLIIINSFLMRTKIGIFHWWTRKSVTLLSHHFPLSKCNFVQFLSKIQSRNTYFNWLKSQIKWKWYKPSWKGSAEQGKEAGRTSGGGSTS